MTIIVTIMSRKQTHRNRHPEAPGEAGPRRMAASRTGAAALQQPGRPSRLPRIKSGVAPQGDGSTAGIDTASLYRLMAWLSPAYPVGAFAYSSGLEWAVESGDIRDAKTLKQWIAAVVTHGGGFCDAVFFIHAHRAAATDNDTALRTVAELAAAFVPSKERFLETTLQGRAFLDATRAAWPCAAIDRLVAAWDGPLAYPIAVGVAAAGHGIVREPALAAFLQAVAANLVSAGVRLVPLGQTDGQRVLAALEPALAATAVRAHDCPLAAVGSAAFRADLASMRHETQHTRLFRS
jgi:urease accessory protein